MLRGSLGNNGIYLREPVFLPLMFLKNRLYVRNFKLTVIWAHIPLYLFSFVEY